jgi:hypothetical protein
LRHPHLTTHRAAPAIKDSLNKKFHRQLPMEFSRAEDEARTRDLNLGKVALYQLSYFRININLKNYTFPKRGCKNKARYGL